MSTGQVPQPQSKAPTNWMGVLATIAIAVASMLAGPHVIPPNPNPPKPVPPVVVVDPVPVPVPEPVVVPPRPPTPIVPPPVIVTGVTIQDAHGNALGNTVDPGVMFTVSANTGTRLIPVPTKPADADIVKLADNKIVCVLKNGNLLQIMVIGDTDQLISIQCNQGPQPPPTPINPPTPVNPPGPVPDPNKVVSVRVLMLFDATANMSKDQVDAMDSPTVVDLLNTKCKKDMANRPAWRKWDKDTVASDYWKQLMASSTTEIASRSLKLPVLCIENGTQLTLCEISNEQSILTALNQTFGG